MKAFDGKSKTVQFKIADGFNKMDVDDPDINLYDLVQGYCADLATVGDLKPAVGVVVCTVCQSEAHESAECPTRKQLAREISDANRAKKLSGGAPGETARRTNPSHAHLTYHSFHKLGHISPNCPLREDTICSLHKHKCSQRKRYQLRMHQLALLKPLVLSRMLCPKSKRV